MTSKTKVVRKNSRIVEIRVTEKETAEIIRGLTEHGQAADFVFGPGWLALEWDQNGPMPKAVELLLLMRGILNENMDGAGI